MAKSDIEVQLQRFIDQCTLFGQARTPVQTTTREMRLVAVGGEIWRTSLDNNFVEFLIEYGWTYFGEPLMARGAENHKLLPLLVGLKSTFQKIENGEEITLELSSHLISFVRFCWDLFIVADNERVQDAIIKRLSHPFQYQGARYELFVAASFIRSGFNLNFLDGVNVSESHCEFTATHKKYKRTYSVEAKSRHKEIHAPSNRTALYRLLQKALNKEAEFERIVFMDLSLPHNVSGSKYMLWHSQIMDIIDSLQNSQERASKWPRAIIFATNGTFSIDEIGGGRISTAVLTGINYPIFQTADLDQIEQSLPEIASLYDVVFRLGNPPVDFPVLGGGFR